MLIRFVQEIQSNPQERLPGAIDMDVVLVTGGTRGLGLAIAKQLSSSGYKTVIVGEVAQTSVRNG